MQMQTQINNPKDAANVQQLLPATVARFAGKYLRHRSFRSFIHFSLLSFSHVSGSLFVFDQKGCLDIILIAITHTHSGTTVRILNSELLRKKHFCKDGTGDKKFN